MFEPKIITDTSMLPKSIETNLDELEPIIAERCNLANSLVVSPDSIEECEKADADATLLTKLGERIKRCRIDWTSSWQSPFEGVIAKCKDYEARLADAAKNLREKSSIGKERVKAVKRGKLLSVWQGKVAMTGDIAEASYFDLYFNTMTDAKTKGNWLNKTAKEEAAYKQMDDELARCAAANATMLSMMTGKPAGTVQVARDTLFKHFDLTEVAQAVARYEEQQERVRQAEEAAKARLEERRRMMAEQPAAPAPAPVEQPPENTRHASRASVTESVPLETYRLAVTGTRAALAELRKWGEAHGISFRNLDR